METIGSFYDDIDFFKDDVKLFSLYYDAKRVMTAYDRYSAEKWEDIFDNLDPADFNLESWEIITDLLSTDYLTTR